MSSIKYYNIPASANNVLSVEYIVKLSAGHQANYMI